MVVPSTGTVPNANSLLSAFGARLVTLPDNTEVQGIYKTRREVFFNERNEAIARQSHRLHLPVHGLGNLAQGISLSIDGVDGSFYVVLVEPDSDGWAEVTLSRNR